MNFSSMEYFETLARERNFTRAAEQLHITQQTLSAHIASLEKELGSQLVVRRNPLELTYAGEVFLRYSEDFRKDRNEMLQEFCDIADHQKGELRIGIALTRGRLLMPRVIRVFQEDYPNILVDLREDTNDALLINLLEGELDLAIAAFSEDAEGLEYCDFYEQKTVLLIHEELFQSVYGDQAGACEKAFRRGDFSLLRLCPMVLRKEGFITEKIAVSLFHRFGIDRPYVKARSSSMETLFSLCLEGIGACFCPLNLVNAALRREERQSVRIFPLGAEAGYRIRFAFRTQSYQWSVMNAFMRCAKQCARDLTEEPQI